MIGIKSLRKFQKKGGSIGAQLSGCILGDLKGSNLDVISYDNSEFNQKLLKGRPGAC